MRNKRNSSFDLSLRKRALAEERKKPPYEYSLCKFLGSVSANRWGCWGENHSRKWRSLQRRKGAEKREERRGRGEEGEKGEKDESLTKNTAQHMQTFVRCMPKVSF